MSSLWRVRVARLGGDWVELALSATHPDAGEPPASAAFAMRLLADTDPERLDREAGPGAYWDGAALDRYAGRVIAEVALSERRNLPFDEEAAHEQVEATLRARGVDPADPATGEAAFLSEWAAFWHDPSRVPSARLTVHLSDPSWLRNLTESQQWETAAYA